MEFMYVPPWLKAFLSITTFFSECEIHTEEIKNECNMYCFDCRNKALCFNCIKSCHNDHRSIQIRRSSYHNVVKVVDIRNHFDIGGIQTYILNNFNVIFLNKRSFDQPKIKRTGKICKHTSQCRICQKNLSDSFNFCSLGCKFAWIKENESGNGSESTVQSTYRTEGKRKMEEEEITKPSGEYKDLCEQNPKRPHHSHKPTEENASSNSSKRKGIPCRAPFY